MMLMINVRNVLICTALVLWNSIHERYHKNTQIHCFRKIARLRIPYKYKYVTNSKNSRVIKPIKLNVYKIVNFIDIYIFIS